MLLTFSGIPSQVYRKFNNHRILQEFSARRLSIAWKQSILSRSKIELLFELGTKFKPYRK